MRINVDASEVMRFANALGEVPEKNAYSIMRSLNQVGDATTREVRQSVADTTGLAFEATRQMVRTIRASRSNLEYQILLRGIDLDAPSSRRIPKREFDQRGREAFEPDDMVRVVTAGDNNVCPICEAIAERSPFTYEEAQSNIHHGAGIGENNCRCMLTAWKSRRTLAVTGRGLGDTQRGAPNIDQRLTLRQLAELVTKEVSGNLRIRVR